MPSASAMQCRDSGSLALMVAVRNIRCWWSARLLPCGCTAMVINASDIVRGTPVSSRIL